MRLVADLRLINSSGIGTYIKNVFPLLLKEFEEVCVLGNQEEIELFCWRKQVKIVQFRSNTYSLTEQFMYPFKIPVCDVLWIPHFNTPLLPVLTTKRLVTIHDVNHLSNPKYFSTIKRIWAKILYKNAVKRSDLIYTVSEFSKSEILKFFKINANKIQVVYGGVDRNFGKENDNQIKGNVPKDYFLFVGNVKPHKNLMTLLKAYNSLDQEIKATYKLVILGKKKGFITGDYEVFKYIECNNLDKNIHFTGYITDDKVPIIYRNAKLFIFPSLYEGFGLPLLEAMACETPVLSSYNASLKEVGEDAVVYFNPHSPLDLKEKIGKVLANENLQVQLKRKGLEQIKKFSWKKSVDKHIQAIKQLNEK